MANVFYFAADADGYCFTICSHEHHTVTSAVSCIAKAGGYVIAFDGCKLRALNAIEEQEFQRAMYGESTQKRILGLMVWLGQISAS
jgi:hypothetical protein